MSLAQLYLSGAVQRWHANPAMAREDQTNADHQGRAAQLLLALHPAASPALVFAVLNHDVGELLAGDLLQPFKTNYPTLAAQHAAVEAVMASDILGQPLPYLSPDEVDWLRLVDKLEALLFVIWRRPDEYRRAASGWRDAHDAVQELADRLGCGEAVAVVIEDLKEGRW